MILVYCKTILHDRLTTLFFKQYDLIFNRENIMNLKRFILPLAAMFGIFASLNAENDRQDGSRFQEELNEIDFQALRDFINTKRQIDLKEKANNLKISGDVRSEWRHLAQKGRFTPFGKNNRLRGGDAVDPDGIPLSMNDFDAEANVYFEYNTDRTWAVMQIQYDNSAGVFDSDTACSCKLGPTSTDGDAQAITVFLNRGQCLADPEGWHGSGNCNSICLKKAYFGYNLYTCDDVRLDVELGRRRLNNAFDSKVQFSSQFDGILFKYSQPGWGVDRWYLNVAGFVVNQRINQFAWIAETGWMNIMDSRVDLKYSFINWRKRGRSECYFIEEIGVRNPRAFDFMVSQVTLAYNLREDLLCRPAQVYGAFLMNHARHRFRYPKILSIVDSINPETGLPQRTTTFEVDTCKNANWAWYAGFKVGKVVKEGDWSIEVQYQYVQPIAVPDNDVRGICRGNVIDYTFTSVFIGNTNFKGWKLEGLYAITDNITLDAIVEWSKAVRKNVGGQNHYSCFKLEAIYAF